MKISEIEQLITILRNSDISEIEIDQDGTHLKLSRFGSNVSLNLNQSSRIIEPAITSSATSGLTPISGSATPASNSAANSNFMKVESPLVGTFYRKPSPEAEVFAKEGDTVKKGKTLCIVEAMKLMNEIEAPCDGKIEKVLVNDGKVVEFGEVLFLINPAI
jgi:acetyl-CoA carboxylase biotin carboxyl carrier protein